MSKRNGNGGRNAQRGTPVFGGILTSDTKRDLYQVAGLPTELAFDNFYSMFRRNGFAKAGIMRPVQKCWSTYPKIFDHAGEGTPEFSGSRFERDVQKLIDNHGFFKIMYSLDYRQRVGRYGGVIIIAKEIDGSKKKTNDAVKVGGVDSIIALRPVYEGQIKENDLIDDMQDLNFGNPKNYTFSPNAASTTTTGLEGNAILHRSRVYAFAEGADDGSIYGTPALEAAFNHMMNLFKIEIAASEGLYKNARQRLHVNVKDKDLASFGGAADPEVAEALNEAIVDFAASFDNELFTSGMEVSVLQSAISDPTGAANICLQAFCTAMDIPKTVLIGFETGERSSSENRSSWNDTMNSRRENVCSEEIKGFLNHLIGIGAIAAPSNGICIEWDDLNEATDSERLAKAKTMAETNQISMNAGTGEVYTPDEIRAAGGYLADDFNVDDVASEDDVDEDDVDEDEDEDEEA